MTSKEALWPQDGNVRFLSTTCMWQKATCSDAFPVDEKKSIFEDAPRSECWCQSDNEQHLQGCQDDHIFILI